jgi:hypothetical protein
LHFGLGSAKTIDEIEIQWPGGKVTKKAQLAINQVIKIVE